MLLLAILAVLRAVAGDPEVMGEHRLGRRGRATTAVVIVLVAACVVGLALIGVKG